MCVIEDKLLWEKVRSSDAEAFECIYKKFCPFLLQTTKTMVNDPLLAEELIQQLFVKLWMNRATIQINDNIKGYLCKMRQHIIYDYHKRQQTATRYYYTTAQLEKSYLHVEEKLTARIHLQQLKSILAQMSPQKRRSYQLVKLEGYSYKVVAQQFSTKERTVRNQVSAASIEISEKMQQKSGISIYAT